MSGWFVESDVRGRAPAIARLQLSPVHAYQRPDDGVAFDSTRNRLAGSAFLLSAGKVAGGIMRFAASYRRIAPGFDVNDLGFLTLSGLQTASASAGVSLTRPGVFAKIPYRRASTTLEYGGVGRRLDWRTSAMPRSA